MAHPFEKFLEEHLSQLIPLEKEINLLWWEVSTKADKDKMKRLEELMLRYRKMYSDKEKYNELKSWNCITCIDDPLLERQLTLLLYEFTGSQMSEEALEKITKLELRAEEIFTTFRGEIDGKQVSNNEIMEILKKEDDEGLRRQAWEASKSVGAEVKDVLLELVEIRNNEARNLGFRDYYAMSLSLNEIDEALLFRVCDQLEELTNEMYKKEKAAIDSELGKRFGTDELYPWHYEDPFFQNAPEDPDLRISQFYEDKDIVALGKTFYDGLGMDVTPVIERSDLFEREGKNQHAFCISIDRKDDVRILANLRPDADSMQTWLHELGHAVYDLGIDKNLPYLLRRPAHTCTTEAVALLTGSQALEESFLERIVGIEQSKIQEQIERIKAYKRRSALVSIRWMLVMVHFEHDLYRNRLSETELSKLWWDYVERFQFINRPKDRVGMADWASKIHLSTAPVYYQNYLFGEVMARQIHAAALKHSGKDTLVENKRAGEFLNRNIFKPGAVQPWNEWLVSATGNPLDARTFVEMI